MKKILYLIIVSLILFLNTSFIFGQEKAIEKKDFNEITKKAEDALKGKTYRVKNTYETYANRNSTPTRVSKSTWERVPPDRFRSVNEYNNEKTETIEIGPRKYYRKNDGEWKEGDDPNMGVGMASGSIIEYEEYKLIEKSKLNGHTVNLYEETLKLKNSSIDAKPQGIETTRYWITKKGVLMKMESKTENIGAKSLQSNVAIYEYNPKNLKIEAPIK